MATPDLNREIEDYMLIISDRENARFGHLGKILAHDRDPDGNNYFLVQHIDGYKQMLRESRDVFDVFLRERSLGDRDVHELVYSYGAFSNDGNLCCLAQEYRELFGEDLIV